MLQNPECTDCEGVGCGCAVRATTLAFNQAYLYEDGQLVRAGQPVQLGGCRETQKPESAGRNGHTPGLMTDQLVVPGPMVPIRCAGDGSGDDAARDPFCVSKALCVITEHRSNSNLTMYLKPCPPHGQTAAGPIPKRTVATAIQVGLSRVASIRWPFPT